MNKLFLILVLAIIGMTSCSDKYYQRKCENHRSKALNGGCLDTSTKVKYVIKDIKGDSVFVDRPIYIEDSTKQAILLIDTCLTGKKIEYVLRNAKIKPLDTTTKNGTRVVAKIINGALKLDITEKSKKDTITIIEPKIEFKTISSKEKSFFEDFWFYLFLMAIGYIILKRIFK